MKEQLTNLLIALKARLVTFSEVLEFIETNYQHQALAFKNGDIYNEPSQNQGSAKVFAFAQINQLDEADTLCLFAEHYQDVLDHPDATNHQNIRQFIANGWKGIVFDEEVLVVE